MTESKDVLMSKVLITTDYLGPGDHVDRLLRKHGYEPTYSPSSGSRNLEEMATLLKGVEGAILASEPVTAEMLDVADQLQVLARSGVGYDSIDVAAATARGIKVCNAPGTNHHSVAELTMGLVITSARQLASVISAVNQGGWPRFAGHELRGATLGVIGYGASGRAVARLGAAFGMNVIVSTAYPDEQESAVTFSDLDEVFRQSDYLSLHTTVNENTHRIINTAHLQMMKPSAILINTARGALVDEVALAQAVHSGTIAGAALDVLETEPLPPDSPLRTLENVIVTSHLAGQTVEARMRSGGVAAQAVIDVLEGRDPAHPVE